jgi:uncharacterized membrane protein YphA (DoxX/SURF4 family)
MFIPELVIRISLASFFGWSAWRKLLDLSFFTTSVGNFQFDWQVSWASWGDGNFFGGPMDGIIAYSVPWFELVAAVALLIPFSRAAGGVVLFLMLVAFNLGLAHAWSLGITDLNCGCHGASETPTNFPLKIAENFGLMLLIAGGFYLRWYHQRLVRRNQANSIPAI